MTENFHETVSADDVTSILSDSVRRMLLLHEEASPEAGRVQYIAARLVALYDVALQELGEAGEIPLLDFEEEGDGVWSAPSRTSGDDGVAFRWRISVTEKPLGQFTLKHSESELVAPLATFPTFAMARECAERKDWQFGLHAKREAEKEAETDRELASRLAGEVTACGDEEEEAEAKPADLITGPGRYPTRGGDVGRVKAGEYLPPEWPWSGSVNGGFISWHGSGRSDPDGPFRHDIVGPRIPDHLSDEAAAAHARMVAEKLRRTDAADLPNDPEPESAKPAAEPVATPEPPAPESLQSLSPGFDISSHCKVRVIALSAEFDSADADLILPGLFEAFEGAWDTPTAD